MKKRHQVDHLAELAKQMRALRAMHKSSLRSMAKYLGVSPATLSRIENSKSCDVDTLLRIHYKTGVSCDVLLGVK